jgi:hypothetical protein
MSNPEEPNAQQDPTPPEINNVISDEVLRARVRKLIDAPKPQRWYRKIIDHQVFTLVLGVLLTWYFGSCLTKQWEQSRLEANRKMEQETRNKDALVVGAYNDFLATLSEHQVRSSLVDQAVLYDAPLGELTMLIRNELEVFAKSRNKALVLMSTIRQLMPGQTYVRIKYAAENGLIQRLDEAMRLHSLIYYGKTNRPKSSDWKNIAGLSNRISICGMALTNAIWYNTPPQSEDNQLLDKKNESLTQMEEGCKD